MLANVVLDHFRNKPIQGAAARGRLLQNVGAVLARLDRALDSLDLTSQASDPIQSLAFSLATWLMRRDTSLLENIGG